MARSILGLLLGCALLAGLPCSTLAAEAGSVGAVQKVIQMLTDISAQAKKEKNEEQVAFAKFETWCNMESQRLAADVEKNGLQIESLTASIGKLESDAKVLGEEVASLNDNIVKFKAEEAEQKDQRAKDHAEFLEVERDFSESVDALERAIHVMEQKSQDVPGARTALLQLADSRLPAKAQSIITALLGMSGDAASPDFASYAAPVADAYEFQSSNIVEMLKRLRDEFRGQLAAAQKAEMNSKHAFDMIMQDLEDSIRNAEKQVAEKSSERSGKEEQAALDKKQLAATTANKAENEKALSALEAECRQKKMSYEEKQHLRTEEIEAINQALDILSSPEVLGNAQKHLALAQGQHGRPALLQVKSASNAAVAGLRRQLREFLQSEGRRLRNPQLMQLAEQAADDPFAKVKSMISNMLTKLYNEANEDAKHEGFCDAELGKSQLTRARLTERIDALTAAVEGGKATILSLTQATAALNGEITDLHAALKEAAEQREAEKAKNAETVKDAAAAQDAVERATAVLKDFYAKAGTATALLQVQAAPQRKWGLKATIKMGSPEWQALANPKFDTTRLDTGHQEGMQTFGDVYQGKQDEINNGALALMEVIASDFANLRADTEAAEAASQRAYQQFVDESNKSLAVKQRNVEMNDADRTAAEARLQEDTKDLKGTEDELLAAERYHANLVPQCIDQGVTWEQRTKDREDEIASLKQALAMLNSGDIA